MRLLSLELKEGMLNSRTVTFSDSTLICSYGKNTQGKTTLVRLILYALGFRIPSVMGIDFAEIDTIIHIENNNAQIHLHRNNYLISYQSNGISYSFYLPKEELELHTLIFGTDNIMLLQNLLGAMYIDQTRGGVVLNRGDIIGNLNFSVESFVAGIQGTEISDIKQTIDIETKTLADYKAMQAIAEYKIEHEIGFDDIEKTHTPDHENIENRKTQLKNGLKIVRNNIRDIEESILSNQAFLRTIESYHLYVIDKDKNEIRVDSNSLKGYYDNALILSTQKKIYEVEMKKIEQELTKMKGYDRIENLDISADSYKEIIDKNLKHIDINFTTINSLVDSTQKNISNLRSTIRDRIKKDSSVIDFMNMTVINCAKQLDVIELIDTRGVLTNAIQNKSGSTYFKLIVAFKIAFLKSLYKFHGIKLPFIIDSLRQNELTDENAKQIISVIRKEVPDHQLIFSSVFNYSNLFANTIALKKRLIQSEE
ncbi:MAG: hypothetical protein WC363_02610 [Candidatus Izemoplasmatales bacterium]|jgi:hypothetical protein